MRYHTSVDWLSHLRQHGFVCISLYEEYHPLVQRVLRHTENFSSFRFPPIDGKAVYSQDFRDVFSLLYATARQILSAVLQHIPACEEVDRLQQGLLCAEEETIFVDANSPFLGLEPFSGTFFNLFHYDYGCLNTHKDRYLITVIAAHPCTTIDEEGSGPKHSCLWVRSAQGKWQNVDRSLRPGEIIVFVGEELERISTAAGFGLYACEHCIRVDPEGAYLPNSHHQRDPQSLPAGNRCSIALVLGERSEES